MNKMIDVLWDDNPIDVTAEANFIWSIANKLRGSYMPDKYGDVIIPMTIIRRFECALKDTKDKVVKLLLASGRNDHSESGEINQFQPFENRQCISPRLLS